MKNTTLALSIAATILGASSLAFAHGPGGGPCGGRGGEKHFERLDANSDGAVTHEELLAKRSEHFDRADENQDGKLTKEERMAMHGEHMKKRFAKRDANNDGKLSADELEGMPEKKLARLDTNGDGAVTQAELEAHKQQKHARHKGKKGRGPWGDETVTKEQIQAKVSEHFTRMDENQDGKLTKDELKAGRRHGKRHGHDHQ